MKENKNKNKSYRKQIQNNRAIDCSISYRFIFSFLSSVLLQTSKILSKNIPIRFANLRV